MPYPITFKRLKPEHKSYQVFCHIRENGGATSSSCAAKVFGKNTNSNQTMVNEILNAALNLGYVTRTKAPVGKAFIYRLTPEGELKVFSCKVSDIFKKAYEHNC